MLTQASHCPQLTQYFGSFVVDRALWIVMEFLEVRMHVICVYIRSDPWRACFD